MPPEERAGANQNHLQLNIAVKAVNHMPKMHTFGKCDAFVMLGFSEQQFQTKIEKQKFDAVFDEEFVLFVHGKHVDLAMSQTKELDAKVAGLALKIDVWDYDKLRANIFIGSTHILLRDLLASTTPTEYTQDLFSNGVQVTGFDTENSTVTILVSVLPQQQCQESDRVWTLPSLQTVLSYADGTRESGAALRYDKCVKRDLHV